MASPLTAAAASSIASRERLAIATRAPSRARTSATPRPMPLLEAITSATRPSIPRSIHSNVAQPMGYVPGVAPAVPEPDQLSKDLVAAATDIYGAHSSRRALHAKGIWCEATFTATDEVGTPGRAPHFTGDPAPPLVRFSSGSGTPESSAASREARGLAAKLRPEGGDETDMLATTARA